MPLRRLESAFIAFKFEVMWRYLTLPHRRQWITVERNVTCKHIFYIGLNSTSLNQKIRVFKQDGGWGIKRSFIPFLGY